MLGALDLAPEDAEIWFEAGKAWLGMRYIWASWLHVEILETPGFCVFGFLGRKRRNGNGEPVNPVALLCPLVQ